MEDIPFAVKCYQMAEEHAEKALQYDEALWDNIETNEWDQKNVDNRLYNATMANYEMTRALWARMADILERLEESNGRPSVRGTSSSEAHEPRDGS